MMRIAIVGGGFAGVNAAHVIGRQILKEKHEVVLFSNTSHFIFRPSLIWVPFQKRTIEEISRPLLPFLQQLGIAFIQKKVSCIIPEEQKLKLEDGSFFEYDYLLLATGGIQDWEAVEGLKDYTLSIYTAQDALLTQQKIQGYTSGPIVVGIAENNPNPGVAYEFLFELHNYVKKKRLSPSFTFFTYEQELYNHKGRKAGELVKKQIEKRGIHYYCGVSVHKVDANFIYLSNGETLPYTLSLIVPPYKGGDIIFASPQLEHQNGLLPTNDYMQSTQWPNIYVVGDLNAREGIKSGRVAELQARVAAQNVVNCMQGVCLQEEYRSDLLYLMELGADGGMFVIRYPGPEKRKSYVEWAMAGHIPHVMKLAFEKYYLWKFSG
jgi:sulfide:quinone oxidoreductase